MQHQILINVIIFVAYVLNLPLNIQRSHSHSQRAGKWSLILAHDRRPIYRAPTYIAVPLLGPHQPRYIGLTLYYEKDTKVGGQNIGYQICFCNQTDYGRGLLNFLSFMPLWLSVKFRFPGISQKMLWGNGLKFCMLMYPDHLQNHCF